MRRRCLPISRPTSLASGAEFAKLIEPPRSIRHRRARPFAAGARRATARPYQIEYGVRASTSAPVLWIEETGCWFAGADGRPARAQGIVRVNNERHARDEQLLKLSRHDPLTGELNRTHLIASLAEAIEEATRFRTSCAFMLIGIDHLARINDAFGFDVADAVIAEVAQPHSRAAARRRRARPLLRQQVRPDPEELHRRRHEYRGRAFSRRHSRRGGADQIGAGLGHGVDRRRQRAALCPQRRRCDQPRAGNARCRQAPPRRIVRGCGGRMSSATRSAASISASPTRSSPRSTTAASWWPSSRWWKRAHARLRSTSAWCAWTGRRPGAACAGYRAGRREARADPTGRSPRARTRGGGTRGVARGAAQPQHLAGHDDGSGLVGDASSR